MVSREKVPKITLLEWKNRVLHIFDQRLQSFLFNPEIIKELSALHDSFVVTTVDKASSNFVFTCKNHYLEVICKELEVICKEIGKK